GARRRHGPGKDPEHGRDAQDAGREAHEVPEGGGDDPTGERQAGVQVLRSRDRAREGRGDAAGGARDAAPGGGREVNRRATPRVPAELHSPTGSLMMLTPRANELTNSVFSVAPRACPNDRYAGNSM